MGWNTWCTQNTCGTDWCTSAEVLDVAQNIKSNGMLAAGYDHINLDDCWGVRDPDTNQIKGDPTRFPEGMPAFIEKVHQLGFKFGLYTDIGPKGCHHPFVGSWPQYQQDANTFKEWQVDYVKFDGCDKPSEGSASQLTCNMSQALNNTGRDMWLNFHCWHDQDCARCGNSFRIGPDHHDNWGSTLGIINLMQKRQDFWGPDPDYGWPDPDFFYTGGQGCKGNHSGGTGGGTHSDPGMRCPGQTNTEYITEFSLWALAGGEMIISSDPRNMTDFMKSVILNDEILAVYNDVAGFRSVKEVSASAAAVVAVEAKACSVSLTKQISHTKCAKGTNFGCLDGGKMWASDGCRGVFTCNGVQSVVCDQMGGSNATCPCVPGTVPPGPSPPAAGPPQVWVRPLSAKGGGGFGAAAVALFNPGDAPVDITAHFADVPELGWGASTQLSVRDLWKHAGAGDATGSYTAHDVPPHGTVMVRLSPNAQ